MTYKLFGFSLFFIIVLISGCVTYESEVTVDRPKQDVETAIIRFFYCPLVRFLLSEI
jgi:hypothetical protein